MEHIWHYSIVALVIGITFIYKFRYQFSIKLLLAVLLVGLSFHNLFLHSDNTVMQLAEQTHQCCVLPAVVTTPEVHVSYERFIENRILSYSEIIYYPEIINFYYSRPPPLFT